MATDKWDKELMEGRGKGRGGRRRGAQPDKTRLPDLRLQPEREQKWAGKRDFYCSAETFIFATTGSAHFGRPD